MCVCVCLSVFWYREAMITRSLLRLREQIVRTNLLVQEAGFIAEELNKRTEYRVTLQIPATNLDANRKVLEAVFLSFCLSVTVACSLSLCIIIICACKNLCRFVERPLFVLIRFTCQKQITNTLQFQRKLLKMYKYLCGL